MYYKVRQRKRKGVIVMADDKLVSKRGIFNEDGDIDLSKRMIIGGNTTNLNDFNNLKYPWTNDWYRQSMNNFWIPEEISLSQDRRDYEMLDEVSRNAFNKAIANFSYLDSIQTSSLANLQVYVTANEINLCISIQNFQESIHNKSYAYILSSLMGKDDYEKILDDFVEDDFTKARTEKVSEVFEEFEANPTELNFVKALIENYILEGLYFYSSFALIYNLGRDGKLPGVVNQVKHIQRDENNHLWLYRSLIDDFRSERSDLFTEDYQDIYRNMLKDAVEDEIGFAEYLKLNQVVGLEDADITGYIKYLGNIRAKAIGLGTLFDDYNEIPASMKWIDDASDLEKTASKNEKVEINAPRSSFIEDDL